MYRCRSVRESSSSSLIHRSLGRSAVFPTPMSAGIEMDLDLEFLFNVHIPQRIQCQPQDLFLLHLTYLVLSDFFHKVGQPYHHTSPFIFHDYRLMHFHLMFHDFGSPNFFQPRFHIISPSVTMPHLGIEANAKRTRCEWKSPGCLRPHRPGTLGARARALRSHWKLKLSTWEVPEKPCFLCHKLGKTRKTLGI